MAGSLLGNAKNVVKWTNPETHLSIKDGTLKKWESSKNHKKESK
tara:strand:+ start:643 stop:774 length:132 start_codon:yes stop_codon:yes gene_type:complete